MAQALAALADHGACQHLRHVACISGGFPSLDGA